MRYMLANWLIFYFSAVWLTGWLAMASVVESEHPADTFWVKVGSYAILFVIWPYIVFLSVIKE